MPLVPLFSRHRSVSVVHVVPLYNKFDCLLLNVILQRLSRSLSESVQCHSSDDNGNNEFTITRHTHFTSRNSKSNPFPFLLRLAGAKRLVDGRNNHGFLHDDLAVVFFQCAFIAQRNRYARATPTAPTSGSVLERCNEKHFNYSACRRNVGVDPAALTLHQNFINSEPQAVTQH